MILINFNVFFFFSSLAKLVHSRKRNLSDDCRRELLRNVKGAISVSAKRFSGYGQHVSLVLSSYTIGTLLSFKNG